MYIYIYIHIYIYICVYSLNRKKKKPTEIPMHCHAGRRPLLGAAQFAYAYQIRRRRCTNILSTNQYQRN